MFHLQEKEGASLVCSKRAKEVNDSTPAVSKILCTLGIKCMLSVQASIMCVL